MNSWWIDKDVPHWLYLTNKHYMTLLADFTNFDSKEFSPYNHIRWKKGCVWNVEIFNQAFLSKQSPKRFLKIFNKLFVMHQRKLQHLWSSFIQILISALFKGKPNSKACEREKSPWVFTSITKERWDTNPCGNTTLASKHKKKITKANTQSLGCCMAAVMKVSQPVITISVKHLRRKKGWHRIQTIWMQMFMNIFKMQNSQAFHTILATDGRTDRKTC